jgi:protein-S-isoprenylcysteine O-methyltransferase Ste14
MVKHKADILVLIQFACLGFLIITGPVIPTHIFLLVLYISGITLGIWAVLKVARKSKLGITPEITRGGKLVTDGPYKYIRHPMYTGVLLVSLSLVVNQPNLMRAIIFTMLAADLVIKLNYEEELLKKYFSDYEDYKHITRKLIPFLF